MGMSPYVAELRGLIGQRALLLPAVSLIIEDDRGRLLLVRQDADGPWFTVGGMVEPDEDPLTAAYREAQEEIGTEVAIHGLLGAFGGPGYRFRYRNGDEVSYVCIAYRATVLGEPVPDMDEVGEVGWFERHDLPGLHLSLLNTSLLADLGITGRPPG